MRIFFLLLFLAAFQGLSQHLDFDDIERRQLQISRALENKIRYCNVYVRDSTFSTPETPRDIALLNDFVEYLSSTTVYDSTGHMVEEISYHKSGTIKSYKRYKYTNDVYYSEVMECLDTNEASFTFYTYDSFGNCIEVKFINRDGIIKELRKTEYDYDENKNVIQTRFIWSRGTSVYNSQYDELNHKIQTSFEHGSYQYIYDKKGRRTEWIIESIVKDKTEIKTHYYKYDKSGRQINDKWVDNTSRTTIHTFQRKFKADGSVYSRKIIHGNNVQEGWIYYTKSGLIDKTIGINQPEANWPGNIQITRYEYFYY